MKLKIEKLFGNLNDISRKYTSFLRVLPDFIIIGAQRCGTSSLYNYLIQHPCIIPARKKELHFFDSNYGKGFSWYKSSFPTIIQKKITKFRKGFALTGEATPRYIFDPYAVERIYKIMPDIKLIFLLRNPVDRAFSHYCNSVKHKREKLSFEEAITRESSRLNKETETFLKNPDRFSYYFSYKTRGHYVEQLEKWFKLFPRENLFFILSEDFFKNPEVQLNRVFKYLGLPEHNLKEYKKFGKSKNKPEMSKELRGKLVKYFNPYNQKLYSLLGVDLDWR